MMNRWLLLPWHTELRMCGTCGTCGTHAQIITVFGCGYNTWLQEGEGHYFKLLTSLYPGLYRNNEYLYHHQPVAFHLACPETLLSLYCCIRSTLTVECVLYKLS